MATLTLGLARAHGTPVQEPLPDFYFDATGGVAEGKVGAARAILGGRLVIVGHHYQRDEVIRWADYTGDSCELAQYGAAQREADYLLFGGVHFMAEIAD